MIELQAPVRRLFLGPGPNQIECHLLRYCWVPHLMRDLEPKCSIAVIETAAWHRMCAPQKHAEPLSDGQAALYRPGVKARSAPVLARFPRGRHDSVNH